MKRIAAALVSLALGFTAACSSTAGTATAPERTGSLADALATVPASVTEVTYYDQARAMERWGVADLDATAFDDESQAEQLQTYLDKSGAAGIGSHLSQYTAGMGDWGWSGLSVDWEITYTTDGPPTSISKLRDELDMNAVMDSLTEHKFSRSGDGEKIRFDRDQSDTLGELPILFGGATVIPSQHLLISTANTDFALPEHGNSLAADDTVSSLLAGLRAADFLHLSTGDGACLDPAAVLGARATPESIEQFAGDLPDVEPIVAAATALIDDEHGSVRTLYAEAASAESDVEARETIMNKGISWATREPYSGLFVADISVNGPRMTYQLSLKTRPAIVGRAVYTRDTPWAFCGG